jgi:hypothetical protein
MPWRHPFPYSHPLGNCSYRTQDDPLSNPWLVSSTQTKQTWISSGGFRSEADPYLLTHEEASTVRS